MDKPHNDDLRDCQRVVQILRFPSSLIICNNGSPEIVFGNSLFKNSLKELSNYENFQSELSSYLKDNDYCFSKGPTIINGNFDSLTGKHSLVVLPIKKGHYENFGFVFLFPKKCKDCDDVFHIDEELWHDFNNPLAILMMTLCRISKGERVAQQEIDTLLEKINTVSNRLIKQFS